MKHQQEAFTLNSNFSKLKVIGEAASANIHMDLAIFDLMEDGNKRTINDIVSMLAVLGYNRADLNRRVVAMLYKKEVFTQCGNGNGRAPEYVIKKTAKRPIARTKETPKMKESEIQIRKAVDTPFKPEPAAVIVEPIAPAPVAEEPTPAVEAAPSYVVSPTDAVKVAIWKTMSDFQPYTLADLATLLDHITERSIKANLAMMVDENMLTPTRQPANKPAVYHLNKGVPMPTGLPDYKPRFDIRKNVSADAETPPAKQPEESTMQLTTPQQDVSVTPTPDWEQKLDSLTDLGNEAMASVRARMAETAREQFGEPLQQVETKKADTPEGSHVKPVEPATTPLIQVGGIFIKGQRFSFRDALVILDELEGAGFTEDDVHGDLNNGNRKFVQLELKIKIAGMVLSVSEAKDVALQLKSDLN